MMFFHLMIYLSSILLKFIILKVLMIPFSLMLHFTILSFLIMTFALDGKFRMFWKRRNLFLKITFSLYWFPRWARHWKTNYLSIFALHLISIWFLFLIYSFLMMNNNILHFLNIFLRLCHS